MSPELGIDKKSQNGFFIRDKPTLKTLLIDNLVWINKSMHLLVEMVDCKAVKSEISSQKS